MLFNKKNKYVLPEKSIEPREASLLIKDQLLDEGNARQNLATFCQTYMEKEATDLLSQTFAKNAIDKSEYPQTAEFENRCVDIIGDLWHAPNDEETIGTSTVGSSEGCMLAGMAMKFRWRNNAQKKGIDINKQKPNLIISSAFQVCWEKFCVYWDIEMRTVPIDKDHMTLNTEKVLDYVDEYTIGIVGILGLTYTGGYDNIFKLNEVVEEYNKNHEHNLVIHVDAASGGLFAPFVQRDLKWDFQLKNVVSISTSGHKYGLVYPGVGWVIWRDKKFLPEELIFNVSYLGGSMPTMAINFSRSASQIIGQYYNFIRFGFEGYSKIQNVTMDIAKAVYDVVEKTGYFEILSDKEGLPVVCYKLKPGTSWSLYDLSDRLMMKGWQVPTYPLSKNMEDVIVQRIVCRRDFTENMAELFVEDFQDALNDLKEAHILFNHERNQDYGFTH